MPEINTKLIDGRLHRQGSDGLYTAVPLSADEANAWKENPQPRQSIDEKTGKAYKVIEPDKMLDYMNQAVQDGAIISRAYKADPVLARKAEPGEQIPVYKKDGTLEAMETAGENDYVLTKASAETGAPDLDQFGHTNSWKVGAEVLAEKYVIPDGIDSIGSDATLVGPRPALQRMVQISEDIAILKPWGENGALVPQNMDAGSVVNTTDPTDMYGIGADFFAETYTVCDRYTRQQEGPNTRYLNFAAGDQVMGTGTALSAGSAAVNVLFNENDSVGEVVPLEDMSIPVLKFDGTTDTFSVKCKENIVLSHEDLSGDQLVKTDMWKGRVADEQVREQDLPGAAALKDALNAADNVYLKSEVERIGAEMAGGKAEPDKTKDYPSAAPGFGRSVQSIPVVDFATGMRASGPSAEDHLITKFGGLGQSAKSVPGGGEVAATALGAEPKVDFSTGIRPSDTTQVALRGGEPPKRSAKMQALMDKAAERSGKTPEGPGTPSVNSGDFDELP